MVLLLTLASSRAAAATDLLLLLLLGVLPLLHQLLLLLLHPVLMPGLSRRLAQGAHSLLLRQLQGRQQQLQWQQWVM